MADDQDGDTPRIKKTRTGGDQRVCIDTYTFETGDDLMSSLLQQASNYQMYRGQADESWAEPLTPTFHRLVKQHLPNTDPSERTRREGIYWSEFYDHYNVLQKDRSDSFDWLKAQFVMQHYGAPTRLLDWTYSPMVALFFACRDYCEAGRCKAGLVWHVNGFALNIARIPHPADTERIRVHTVGRETPRLAAGEDWFANSRTIAEEMIARNESWPFVVHPPVFDDRMVAQQAVFTFHADAPGTPADWKAPEFLWRGSKSVRDGEGAYPPHQKSQCVFRRFRSPFPI